MIIRYVLPAIAALVLIWSVRSISGNRTVKATAAPPAQPPIADFANPVGAVGLVEASGENIALSVPVPGLVTRVLVTAGDRIAPGQVLLMLDDRDLRAELALREANVAVARTRLEKLRQSPRPEELPPAEARVRDAEQQLADASVQLRLIESVTDRRAIREEDLLRRRVAVSAAQARLAEAKSNLDLLKAGAWGPDLRIAESELAQAERQVQRIQADLDRLVVRSPIAGRVLQCKVRAGEYAAAGPLSTPLMLLGQTDRLHLRADIDERDAWRVRHGAPAYATVRGNSKLKYALAWVRTEPYVVPKRNLSSEATERVDTRVLQVVFSLPEQAPLYAGQQMDVYLQSAGEPQ